MTHEIHLGNLYRRRDAESRSISAENPLGQRGAGGMATAETSLAPLEMVKAARELGRGWKVSPCIPLAAGQTATLMDHDGPGIIRHVWFTFEPRFHRDVILRLYWDNSPHPSIECPAGDFFCQGWRKTQDILAIPMNVNPAGGMNCFLPMPFRGHARITVTNDSPAPLPAFFYTINYTLEAVDEDALYLHAQWRRSNPTAPGTDHIIVDGIRGQGQYIGTFMCWQQNSEGWWGEGEMKMFLDGDGEFPTICGTGTEDYFGGAWGFADRNYSAPYFGYQDIRASTHGGVSPAGPQVGRRVTLYRFHVQDPIFFKTDLRATMQCLGWRDAGRYLPLQDDVSSVAYWYQTLPHAPFPPFPARDAREII
ncbi:MAG TPA: glycoside hydrolase family 172 protein [Tepidisphaeraceae bacterium]|jgi:hypothetical protein